MFEHEQQHIEKQINAYLKKNDIPAPEELKWSSIPFAGEWGTSTSFFETAALEARSGKRVKVPVRAQEIAEQVVQHLGTPEGYARAEAVRGYLNLYYETGEFSRRVIDTAIDQADEFGHGLDKGEQVMVEFAQPNTHKAMHVGHLRNMMFGAAVANILEFAGFDVIRSTYFGDYGRDVMKWIWNYRKRHAEEQPPETDVTKWMGDLYSEANRMLENDPNGDEEIGELFNRWEAKDPEIYGMWEETRQWSLDGFYQIFDQMGVRFDHVYTESQMEAPSRVAVKQLLEAGIAVDERSEGGPVIVKIDELLKLDKEKFRVLMLMRSDGTALYGAWDVALAQKKFEDYPEMAKSIYVVDVRQSLHFTQVFKTLEIYGWENTDKTLHLPYEVVTLPGNMTMSSREGTIVLLEDLIREAVKRAYEVSQERNPELDELTRKDVAKKVGLGAIKYPLLARDNTKVAIFDWDTALDFNGHAAPYIQYAYVRANSLLKRMETPLPRNTTPTYDLEKHEIELIELISEWPAVVQKAAEEYKTLTISNHAYELAKAFNEFYNHCPVLKAEPEVRDFRLRLVVAAKTAVANSLGLLGITVPEVM